MHERSLHVDADQHAEPDQVDAHLLRHRREQWNNDEGDLEVVEKEGKEKYEHVDEDKKADDAPRQVEKHALDPQIAVDSAEREAENGRHDQNEHHHRGQFQRGIMPCLSRSQVRRRCMIASASAPTAPIAPPSVGVASPTRIVPSTMKISTSDGTIDTMQRTNSTLILAVRTSLGSAGTFSGQMMLTMKIQTQNSATRMKLGMKAPAYMSPTERPMASASTTSTSEGGMIWVIVPDAAITPVETRGS